MNYKIALSKLNKLFNPFDDKNSIFFESQDIITKYIEDNDIFTSDIYIDSNLKLKEDYINENYIQYKKLAYEIANYEPKQILIELKEENFTDIESIISKGLLNLYAVFYKSTVNNDIEEIIVQIEGNEKVIKSLLGNDIDNYLTEEKVEDSFLQQIVYYEVPKNFLEENLGNSEYVLSQLEKTSSHVKQLNLNLVLPNVWEDKGFIEKLFKNYKSVEKSRAYILNDTFYEILKEDRNNFSDYWEKVIRFYQKEIINVTKEEYENQKKIYMLLNSKNYIENNEEEILLNSKKIIFYYNVQQEFFENIDNLIDLIKSNKNWSFSFYETASFEKKFDKKLLDAIYNEAEVDEKTGLAKTIIDPHYNLIQEQYSNYQYMKNFLVNYANKMDFHKIFSIVETRFQITEFNKIVSSFINDKEKVLDLINNINDKNFTRIYMLLPYNLKKDKDIIKTVLSQDINLYLDVPIECRQEYKKEFILNGSDNIISNKEFKVEEIINIPEKSLLEKLLKAGNTHWLKTIDCPLKWKQDSSLLDLINNVSNFTAVKAENPLYKTILSNKNFLKKLVIYSRSFYNNLPDEYKEDKELLDIMALVHSYIPSKHFSNRKLCLEALLTDQKYIVLIPKPFWYEREFILGVAKAVDKNLINKNIFQQPDVPKELNQLLIATNVNKDYEDFFSSYFIHQKLENTVETKKIINKKKI